MKDVFLIIRDTEIWWQSPRLMHGASSLRIKKWIMGSGINIHAKTVALIGYSTLSGFMNIGYIFKCGNQLFFRQ